MFLLIPPLAYFTLTLQSALNIGYRHLLPMLPFLYVLASGAAMQNWEWGMGNGKGRKRNELRVEVVYSTIRNLQSALWIVFILILLSDLLIHPHYLSYFNRLAGGPENGRNILIDSNIDWGQDLRRLRDWMAENDVDQVKLGWFGTARPAYYGIAYEPLPGLGGVGQPQFFDAWWNLPFDPAQPEPGLYAISVTSLWEFPLTDKYVYAWFRARPPDARIGYSILIYEVE